MKKEHFPYTSVLTQLRRAIRRQFDWGNAYKSRWRLRS